jgi:uncharacterized protein (UPF0332 family)
MTGRDFLPLAFRLVAATTEAEWRTAVSRAYYAAFHVARVLFEDLGFAVPRGEQAHGYLWLRLHNCGNLVLQQAGANLQALRRQRNRADYDFQFQQLSSAAVPQVRLADNIIRGLDSALVEPIRSQIATAMRIYQHDVLHDVTWHP